MCLTITGFKTRKKAREFKPLIAKEDIKVYKVLLTDNTTPYQYFKYEKGYHYTVNKFSKLIYRRMYPSYWRLEINKGLHSFINFNRACGCKSYGFNTRKIVIMYIPKNSQYYLGDDEDIVSNNLIWY